jgi:hypothetical protein
VTKHTYAPTFWRNNGPPRTQRRKMRECKHPSHTARLRQFVKVDNEISTLRIHSEIVHDQRPPPGLAT